MFPTLFPILSFSVRGEQLGNRIRSCIALSIPHVMPLRMVVSSAWRSLNGTRSLARSLAYRGVAPHAGNTLSVIMDLKFVAFSGVAAVEFTFELQRF